METVIMSGGLKLVGHLARPSAAGDGVTPAPGLVLCHGFPLAPGEAATSAASAYPDLAERLAAETGWTVLTFNFRGTGASEGDFSLAGWLDDVGAAIEALLDHGVAGVWLGGSSTGGALAICRAAEDDRVRGVATLAARADFSDWARDPSGFLDHARAVGVVRNPAFPPDVERWGRELREIRPVDVIAKIPPRPVLLIHGSDDDVVPVDHARVLTDAALDAAELHVLSEAGHRLRHDPRAVALLLGWMERQART